MRWPVLIISALAVARRRTLLRWSAALGLVIALGAPAGALASADVETVHFGGSVTQASVNPCNGAPGIYDVMFEGVSHTSIAAACTLPLASRAAKHSPASFCRAAW